MGISGTVAVQLSVAVGFATVLFFLAYSLPRNVGIIFLLLLIPFQPIETQYFTANVLLTYGVFIAWMLRRGAIHLPLLPQILILLFCYFLTFSQVHPANYIHHAAYIFALISAFIVFWMTYNLTVSFKNDGTIVKVFVAINVAVVIYCAIQIGMGPGTKLVLFGNEDFSMMPMRTNRRLSGPFGAVGLTAEYFVIMVFVVLHELMHTSRVVYKRWLMALVGMNILMLIATANRTAFILLIVGGIAYVAMFRRELGMKRVIGLVTGGTSLLILISILLVTFTSHGGMFERLANTSFEDGVPDTRQTVWPFVWKEVKSRPLLGHGPRLRFRGGAEGRRYEGHTFVRYPHNLYLFLLFTIGAVGLIAFLVFLGTPLFRCWKRSLNSNEDPYIRGLAKMAVLVLLLFFADQMKLSFMRMAAIDYWHFIFALLGMFVGVLDRSKYGAHSHASGIPT